jgi:hypothetical protein
MEFDTVAFSNRRGTSMSVFETRVLTTDQTRNGAGYAPQGEFIGHIVKVCRFLEVMSCRGGSIQEERHLQLNRSAPSTIDSKTDER